MPRLETEKLTGENFAAFGDVIDARNSDFF